jgi:adenosylcobyric acid synthase
MPQKIKSFHPLMVVGTGSHVGKSVLCAGLCRVFRQMGVKVAPFKAQNMALNSGITPEGGEMGRAQITQAEAAGVTPHVDMNPILLKPTSDIGSQVVLLGQVLGNYKGVNYYKLKSTLVPKVMAAFERLKNAYELVILEGAGSCAEVNLKQNDLVNMSMALRARAKVLIVADIDAGGVFAQILGTLDLLPPEERELVAGIVINKFRGDPTLFQEGIRFIEEKGGKPVLGLIPHFDHIQLPQEDGVALERGELKTKAGSIRVGVVRLSHISNYTDADVLASEEAVELHWVDSPGQLAGLDLLILPGSKNTLAALSGLKKSGLYEAIPKFHQLGGKILGLCGGYQLLGKEISDPLGVEGPPSREKGLGLLDMTTEMQGQKTTTRARAMCLKDLPFSADGVISGYEIHMGATSALGIDRPALRLISRLDQDVNLKEGQVSQSGRVVGTYLHGFLDNDSLRLALLNWVKDGKEDFSSGFDYAGFKDRQYDLLADHLRKHLNLDELTAAIEL